MGVWGFLGAETFQTQCFHVGRRRKGGRKVSILWRLAYFQTELENFNP